MNTPTATTGDAASHEQRRALTADEVRALGVTTSLSTAAALFGLSRATAYRLAGKGTFPVPVLRAGSQYRVPVAPILAVLFPPDSAGQRPSAPGSPAAT